MSGHNKKYLFDPKDEALIINDLQSERAEGYRIPGQHVSGVEVREGRLCSRGFGESATMETARAKAISEAIERLELYKNAETLGATSSNGWAAHVIPELARQAAVSELIERAVAIQAWVGDGSYSLIPQSLWPKPIQLWVSARSPMLEFSELKIVLVHGNLGCAIMAVLFNSFGGCVTGFGSGLDFESAIFSAAQECMRAAHSALRFEWVSEVLRLHSEQTPGAFFDPGVHAVAYAYTTPFPTSIIFAEVSKSAITEKWSAHQESLSKHCELASTVSWKKIDRWIVQAILPRLPVMTWNGYEYLRDNKHPHPVG